MVKPALRNLKKLAVLFVLAAWPAAAGGPFEAKFGRDAAKLSAEVKLSLMNGDGEGSDSGRGSVPYLKALGAPPARIALISFYARDCGNKKENSYNVFGGSYAGKTYTWHTKTTRAVNLKEGAVAMLATELQDAGIAALKEAFGIVGSQLLTPEEFLDTPAKREAYEKFTFERNFAERLYLKVLAMDTDSWRFAGASQGYRLIELTSLGSVKDNDFRLATTGPGVAEVAQKAGHDLARALGVDAVAILYNVVQGRKDEISLRGSYLYLFGPNPVPNKGQSMYWRGHQYSGVYLAMDVPFVKTDKDGHLVEADYEGYGLVAKALGLRMAQHLKQKTGWDGKPRPGSVLGAGPAPVP